EADLAAEMDRGRVAAVLAADAELDAGAAGAAAPGGGADHLADPGRIEADERVMREDAGLLVGSEEARRVVARDAEHGLRQVIGAEAEEFGALGDLAGEQRSARQLDHRADEIR